ncbi:MAG: hypothetical protein JWN54_2258 [Mycobacterium sp.]|nr:hypothetical protein [Mycobacterium sp.]
MPRRRRCCRTGTSCASRWPCPVIGLGWLAVEAILATGPRRPHWPRVTPTAPRRRAGFAACAGRAGPQLGEELSRISDSMTEAADTTATRISTVGASAADVGAHVGTVAGAADQMGASIREIAQNAERASTVADEAATAARDASGVRGGDRPAGRGGRRRRGGPGLRARARPHGARAQLAGVHDPVLTTRL